MSSGRGGASRLLNIPMGLLGGGNHYIEIDTDGSGYYLAIHSGSRNIGELVAEHYQRLAARQAKTRYANFKNRLLERLRKEGRENQIETAVARLKKDYDGVPPDLALLNQEFHPEEYQGYLDDMVIRREIGWDFKIEEDIDTIHNYPDLDHMILRKGAVSAWAGEKLVIPLNIRDGLLVCRGKGNPDWNHSAPHGAGRSYSRSRAKKAVSLESYQEAMRGIYSTPVSGKTKDESPFAYKDYRQIMTAIEPTVDILERLRPVYNFKES